MMRWSIATLCLSGLLLWAGWQPDASPTPLQWTNIDGKTVRLSDLRDAKAVVFITLSTRCPAVPRYAPRLNRLYETYHPRGVAFYGIYPEADETLEGIRAHAQQLGLKFPIVRQGAVAIARAVGATHVPQAFVLNRKGEVAYSGAIDSVTKREVVQHQYLRDALDATLQGKRVRQPRTQVVGCFLTLPDADEAAAPAQVTFAEHIAPSCTRNARPATTPATSVRSRYRPTTTPNAGRKRSSITQATARCPRGSRRQASGSSKTSST